MDPVGSSPGVAPLAELFDANSEVGGLRISVIMVNVDGHGQHLGNHLVHTLNTTVTVRAVGADGEFAKLEKLIDGA